MKKIKNILNDLYAIDPELRKYEKTLEKLVAELLAMKPDTKFDEVFARDLKQKVMSLGGESIPEKKYAVNFSIPRFAFAFGGVALVLMIALVATSKLPGVLTRDQANLSFADQKFSRLGMKAFGTLGAAPVGGERGSAAFGMGGGGGGVASSAPQVESSPRDTAVSKGMTGTAPLIYPYNVYKYVYKGEPVELTESTIDVYKRIPPSSNNNLVSVLNSMGFGSVNLGSFGGANLTNFELTQSGNEGYIVNVNLREGMISIYRNWATWYPECREVSCPPPSQIKAEDVPADQTLISMADQFLKDHGINMTNYDKAEVDNQWRINYAAAEKLPAAERMQMPPYVPDVMSVVYPLKVNGNVVHEMGGEKRGIRVSIDIRKNKVSDVWGVMTQDYQSSSYEAETSSERIIKIAENGGAVSGFYLPTGDPNATVVELELDTPRRVLTTNWSQNGEIIVPALLFPVKGIEDKQIWPKYIVIPLAKELLTVKENPGNPVRIMEGRGGVAEPAVGAADLPAVTPAVLPKQ